MRQTDLSDDGLLEYSMDFGVQKLYLEENDGLKKKIINEIPSKINLKSTTRSYVESFSETHNAARDLINESVHNARQKLEEAYSQFRRVHMEYSGSLIACIDDNEEIIEMLPLTLCWDDIRIKLQKRNRMLVNLKNSYLTGKIEKS
jgi:hypothetical protein